jgi:hypothetical protein
MTFDDNDQMGLHQSLHLSQTSEKAPSLFISYVIKIEYMKQNKKKIKRDSFVECHFFT